jgi:Glycosyltransferase family 87
MSKLFRSWAVFVALHALIALVSNSHRVFYGAVGPYAVSGHIEIFYNYASRALEGSVPYRDFTVEYPILAFVVFLVPRLIVSDFTSYKIAFGIELLLFNAAAVYLVARRVAQAEGIGRVPGRLGWYTLLFASLCPLVMGPYDLVPMAMAFAAACWWFSGRNALGGLAAGLGTLTKFFPGLVAVPALVWELSCRKTTRARGLLALLGTLVVGGALWYAIGSRGMIRTFSYHAERGLEIESLYAGIVLAYGRIVGQPVPWVFDHTAFHLAPEWSRIVTPVVLPIQAAALLLVAWRYRQSGRSDGVRFAGAAILAFIITGKVLSPQFLTWLLPFAVVLEGELGRRSRWLLFLACLTTTIIYPWGALALILNSNLGGILILNYRNGLLLWLLFLWLFGPKTGLSCPELLTKASMGGPGCSPS